MTDEPHPVEQFVASLKEALPTASTKVDAPDRPEGHWVVDVEHAGHDVVVEWRAKHGFGVTSSAAEAGFGEGPEEVYEDPCEVVARVVELIQRKERTRPPEAVLLRELRELAQLTQEELAKRLGIRQASVSKMERRQDMTLGTLRRVIEALGGKLEVTARFPQGAVRIAQFEVEPDDARGRASK